MVFVRLACSHCPVYSRHCLCLLLPYCSHNNRTTPLVGCWGSPLRQNLLQCVRVALQETHVSRHTGLCKISDLAKLCVHVATFPGRSLGTRLCVHVATFLGRSLGTRLCVHVATFLGRSLGTRLCVHVATFPERSLGTRLCVHVATFPGRSLGTRLCVHDNIGGRYIYYSWNLEVVCDCLGILNMHTI